MLKPIKNLKYGFDFSVPSEFQNTSFDVHQQVEGDADEDSFQNDSIDDFSLTTQQVFCDV